MPKEIPFIKGAKIIRVSGEKELNSIKMQDFIYVVKKRKGLSLAMIADFFTKELKKQKYESVKYAGKQDSSPSMMNLSFLSDEKLIGVLIEDEVKEKRF
ncbi:MAG: hypothetical protein PHF84_06405 [bacterium]|nr:hypothetical protein [bacterium]